MDQDEFQLHVVSALADLDAKMESLVGNGQPGRISKLEDKVEELQKQRWTMAGIVTGVSAVAGGIIHFVFKR